MPTCQVLPPNFPGYEPYCPYTAGADSDNTKWTGVDLTKAKDLVKQSGTSGAKVVVVGTTDEVGKALALQMVSDLKAIGYDASAKLLAPGPQYPYVQNSDNHVQVGWSAWYQDYPAASDFLNVLLGCDSYHPHSDASPNIAGFCDKDIQAKMDQAVEHGRHRPGGCEQDLGAGRPRRDRPGCRGSTSTTRSRSTSCPSGCRATSGARSGTCSTTRSG